MNSTSIAEYILKLEKLDEECCAEIKQLKHLPDEVYEELVRAVESTEQKISRKTTSHSFSDILFSRNAM